MHIPRRELPESAQPCGRTVWGTTGGTGVHGLEQSSDQDGNKYTVCTSRNKRHRRTDPALKALDPVISGRDVHEFRVGAAGHHLLCVLESRADLYLQFCAGCKRWDTCAGEALLRAGGGLLTDAAGAEYDYGHHARSLNARGLIAHRSRRVVLQVAELVGTSIAPFPAIED